MDLKEVISALTPLVLAVLAALQRSQNKTTKATHKAVTNDLHHDVAELKDKLDRVATRVDDHIEAHKERNRAL